MNGIIIPAGDVTKMPVIGKVLTVDITATGTREVNIPGKWFDVVALVEDGTIYVRNEWYKPGVPCILHKDLVKEFVKY